MRPAALGLATGVLPGGRGQGAQLFEEPLDLSFGASRYLHLLPAFCIATDKTKICIRDQFLDLLCMCVLCPCWVPVLSRLRLVGHGVAEQSSLIFVSTGLVGALTSGVHLSKRLPQLLILLFQAAQR